jgi:hypothetical protein
MRLFFILSLISFSALAAQWGDLVPGKSYSLSQSFQLPQLERSGSFVDFSKGEDFRLKEVVPLSATGLSLILHIFHYTNCPGIEMTTDMEIIPVKYSNPLVEVGVQLEECELNMYIETRDQNNKSLFE